MVTHSIGVEAGEILESGIALVDRLDDATYVRPCPPVFHGSVGAHFRHVLDHFRLALEMAPTGRIDYECRVRGTAVETSRSAALALANSLAARLRDLPPAEFDRPVHLAGRLGYGNPEGNDRPVCPSTLGREIVFCVSHAIHHFALIRVICGTWGLSTADHFGVAPATVAHAAAA